MTVSALMPLILHRHSPSAAAAALRPIVATPPPEVPHCLRHLSPPGRDGAPRAKSRECRATKLLVFATELPANISRNIPEWLLEILVDLHLPRPRRPHPLPRQAPPHAVRLQKALPRPHARPFLMLSICGNFYTGTRLDHHSAQAALQLAAPHCARASYAKLCRRMSAFNCLCSVLPSLHVLFPRAMGCLVR